MSRKPDLPKGPDKCQFQTDSLHISPLFRSESYVISGVPEFLLPPQDIEGCFHREKVNISRDSLDPPCLAYQRTTVPYLDPPLES